jgi:ABC-type transport system involved in multi-copper enzyme maturation permease subunit
LRGGDRGPGSVTVTIQPRPPVGDPLALSRTFALPPVGDRPLLWKEQHFGGGTTAWEMFRVAEIVLTGYALVVGTTMVLSFWVENDRRGLRHVFGIQTVVPMTLFIVGVALRAAGSVSRERERRTLDSLLTLPGGRAEVLRAKWLGSVSWCRWAGLGLLAMWAVGTLVGGVSPVGLALLLLAGVAHVGFVASAGLYLSVAACGTGAATFGVVLVLLAACGVPWLAWSLWDGLATPAQQQAAPWLGPLLWDGLLPPVTWWALAGRSESIAGVSGYAVIAAGLALYAGAAGLFWWRAVARFQRDGQVGPRGRAGRGR